MTYKTIVTDYAPKAKKMADEIEKVINEKAKDGWEPVTFSVTNSYKAILSRNRCRRKECTETLTPKRHIACL